MLYLWFYDENCRRSGGLNFINHIWLIFVWENAKGLKSLISNAVYLSSSSTIHSPSLIFIHTSMLLSFLPCLRNPHRGTSLYLLVFLIALSMHYGSPLQLYKYQWGHYVHMHGIHGCYFCAVCSRITVTQLVSLCFPGSWISSHVCEWKTSPCRQRRNAFV